MSTSRFVLLLKLDELNSFAVFFYKTAFETSLSSYRLLVCIWLVCSVGEPHSVQTRVCVCVCVGGGVTVAVLA